MKWEKMEIKINVFAKFNPNMRFLGIGCFILKINYLNDRNFKFYSNLRIDIMLKININID